MANTKSKRPTKTRPKPTPKLDSKRGAHVALTRRLAKRPLETAVPPWSFLVRRRHTWRMQLYVKGRNLTARQLVGSIKANQFDEQKAAANYHLPIEAIREALAYVAQNWEFLEIEAEIERLMGKREGARRVAQRVS
jgi:uncharacterized protein (DUF433 family)